jgi:hypothetical protein
LNITNFCGGRASSSRRAAFGCVCSFVLLACATENKRVVPARQAPDSGDFDGGLPPRSTAELCLVTEQYVSERKGCASDADCSLLTYQPACCVDQLVVGIGSADLEAALICKETNNAVCRCPPGLIRTEDNRVVNEGSPATVQCFDQRCTSRVARRQCGATRVCTSDEICVTYENIPGGFPPDLDSGDNAYLTYRCEPNPCPNQLGCDCAQPLCDARNDALRRCEIKNNAEADLTCRAFVD